MAAHRQWTAARVGGASLPSSASTRRPGFFRAEADLDRLEVHRRWVKLQTQPWVVRVRRPGGGRSRASFSGSVVDRLVGGCPEVEHH